VIKPDGLEDPVSRDSERVVAPVDSTKHTFYKFYVQVTSLGGSKVFYGDYDLYVGCTMYSVTYTDNDRLVLSVPLNVGADP